MLCFQSELKTVKDQNRTVFVELGFKVLSDPSERLTIDHIIQDKDEVTKGSAVVPAGLLSIKFENVFGFGVCRIPRNSENGKNLKIIC